MTTDIALTNVLTRKKEAFEPLVPGQVNLYVCGPTVQDYMHIGHAKTYIAFDVIVRYLRYRGLRVRYVQNITDVGHLLDSGEDRILKGAARDRIEPMEVVETYMREYFADMDSLGVGRPDISPRASGHIPEQIEMIKTLLAGGYAYEVNGSVYFNVSAFPEYGKLSGRRVEEAEAGAREAVREEKRSPEDFALWKDAPPEHILKWPSPWGWGYPGWHVECSAMATKYLGETFDIHGGGRENIFPHNECEIAQAEAATGKPFARYWLLTGSLTLDGVKMSKSLGNVVRIKDAVARNRPEAIRYFMLSAHYSGPIDYTDAALEASTRGWERIAGAYTAARQWLGRRTNEGSQTAAVSQAIEDLRARFVEAMNDDFNAPVALTVVQELARLSNTLINGAEPPAAADVGGCVALFEELAGRVLGILPKVDDAGSGSAEREAGLVELLIEMRKDARARKDFAASDRIRDQLKALGVVLEDGKAGTTWKVAS
ncbi:MAG TPA: cysteine--tRNA ligase [Anaerolineales bacterium]|nr:cysteine--tRNA ligase [Anaerolineales bacterium]